MTRWKGDGKSHGFPNRFLRRAGLYIVAAEPVHTVAAPAPVVKPDTVRPLGPVDAAPLKALVERFSERMWVQEDERKENDFFCFHHTRHVVLRFTRGNRDPRDHYASPAWDVFAPVLLPIMQRVIEPYGFEKPGFPKAMFARLEAGHEIDQHVDGAGSNLLTHKIHVPVVTNPDALFYVNGEPFHLEVGQAYEVNNVAPHAVVNRGTEDRIHFIFEVFETAA